MSSSLVLSCCCMLAAIAAASAQRENIEIPADGSFPALPAVLVRPNGTGPFPAMVVLHGVGGMWSSTVNGRMISNFEEWATIFPARKIVAIFADSYTPRGFPDFRNRRPAENASIDDSLVSPAYVRPRDAFRVLNYLRGLSYVRSDAIGVMGFSHGGETALSSVLHSSISKNPWRLSYMYNNGTMDYGYEVPAPIRPDPIEAGGFNVCVVWYPGCGFYGYYGSLSASAGLQPNNYMPYTRTLMMHGTIDPLFTGGYPPLITQKSLSHATSLGISYNPLFNVTYDGAAHSFDQVTDAAPGQSETADQTAKRLGRVAALNWLDMYLLSPISPPSSSSPSPASTAAPSGGSSSPSQSSSSPAALITPARGSSPSQTSQISGPPSCAPIRFPAIILGLSTLALTYIAFL